MPTNRDIKRSRYTGFADVGKIFANATRLEIVDALIQRPRSVENIASSIGQSIASTSQHLQVLKRVKAVETERQGTTIVYSLTEGTLEVFIALRNFAEQTNPSLILLQQQRSIKSINFEQVQHILRKRSAVLLDVRSELEFQNGHIKGAINIPLQDLSERYAELVPSVDVIVTCRGPYCVSSDEAAAFLLTKDYSVVRYDDGIGEWSVRGGEVARLI